MPKTTQSLHAEFAKANTAGDLAAGVHLARTVVVKNILNGAFEDDPASLAALLIGDRRTKSASANTWEEQGMWLFAALCMGVALGQLVHADVFTTDGAA